MELMSFWRISISRHQISVSVSNTLEIKGPGWTRTLCYHLRQIQQEDILLLNPVSIHLIDKTIQQFLNSERAIQHIPSDPDLRIFILPNMCGVLLAGADVPSSVVC